jgi:hypothetical protein
VSVGILLSSPGDAVAAFLAPLLALDPAARATARGCLARAFNA